MSVLNEMGVIGTPSRPIIMAKKNSEFFTSSDAATGDIAYVAEEVGACRA
jgi:hypothetical protein